MEINFCIYDFNTRFIFQYKQGSLLGNENPQNIQHLVHHILNQRSLVQYTIAFQLGP